MGGAQGIAYHRLVEPGLDLFGQLDADADYGVVDVLLGYGVQDALAYISDVIQIIPSSDIAVLPRWRNRFDQPIGIAAIRDDAHIVRQVDELPPSPGVDDKHISGRIFFTKPFQCQGPPTTEEAALPATPDGGPTPAEVAAFEAGETSDIEEDEVSTPICGEMIFDTLKADADTDIQHETGEWRPMLSIPQESTEDYSWHHPGSSYYPGGGIPTPTGGGGDPTPTGTGTSPGTLLVLPDGIPSVDAGARTTQAQHGWAPPESPSNTQRLNILLPGALNSVGTFVFTKPENYNTIIIEQYLKISDPIPPGRTIELNLVLAAWDGAAGPTIVSKQAIKMTSLNMVPGAYKVARRTFTGYSTGKLLVTGYLERRNDVDDVTEVEVWVPKTARMYTRREYT